MTPNKCLLVPRNALILPILLLLAALCNAQNQKLSPEKRALIENAVSKFMASTHVPGVSVAVVENGEYEWSAGFGFADLENNVPATEHTLFRLASVSKSLTAVGALELFERGQLDLDAPIQKYCPAFPKKQWPVTTREVLGHLAGVRHYKTGPEDLEINNTKHFDNPIQGGLDFFKNEPLLTEPGTHFQYSTMGYTLLGCAMEGAAGKTYVDFMLQNVFAPAGMEHTLVDDRFAIIPYRTRFYRKTKSGDVQNSEFLDSSYKIPGGGWLSTAGDIARFEVAILNDKLIKRSTRDLMWTPMKPPDDSAKGYAMGWHTSTDDGVFLTGHTGGQQGTNTNFEVAPEKRAGVVVLSNMEEISTNNLSKEIMRILLGTAAKDDSKH
jgi:serine beta-lactamase-like protein LACTB, mitochondrial